MALLPMDFLEKAEDVTSQACNTSALPTGLSINYPAYNKFYRCGNFIFYMMMFERTTAYTNGTQFAYIKDGFKPINRVYGLAAGAYSEGGTVKNDAITSIIFPDGKVLFTGIYDRPNATVGTITINGIYLLP
jgi:hypothetical protein